VFFGANGFALFAVRKGNAEPYIEKFKKKQAEYSIGK